MLKPEEPLCAKTVKAPEGKRLEAKHPPESLVTPRSMTSLVRFVLSGEIKCTHPTKTKQMLFVDVEVFS